LKIKSQTNSVVSETGNMDGPSFLRFRPVFKNIKNAVFSVKLHLRDERKGKERKRTCIAPIVSMSTTKRSDVDHTELPANTPHLPFLRISIR